MPLKSLFPISPLYPQPYAPLDPIRVKAADTEAVCALLALADQTAMTDSLCAPVLRCSLLTGDTRLYAKASAHITNRLEAQEEDGRLSGAYGEQAALMTGAAALFASEGSKAVLEKMMRWCASLHANWGEVCADQQLMAFPADLMETLIFLHTVTKKKALLTLMERLRQSAMDWTTLMATWSVQQPMKRVASVEELCEGMAAEGGDIGGFYTRQYYATYGPAVAQGMRATAYMGCFSGGETETEAGRTGYRRIMRWHGTASGAFTSDMFVAGGSPSAGLSGQTAGETAASLAYLWQLTGKADMGEALARITENALPVFVRGGKLVPMARLNGLSVNCGTKDCYRADEPSENAVATLAALLRAQADAACSAVCQARDGLAVALYRDGAYTVRLGGKAAKVTLTTEGDTTKLVFSMKENAEAKLALRIPSWAKEACVAVNAEGGDAPEAGSVFTIARTWHDGDTVSVSLPASLCAVEGYHQSVSLLKGDTLLACPVTEDASFAHGLTALNGDDVQAAPVAWKTRGAVPADPPIEPAAEGEAQTLPLVPFALTDCRIAAFPVCKGCKDKVTGRRA